MIRNIILGAAMLIGAIFLVDLISNTLEQNARHASEAYAPPSRPYAPGTMK
jgi:hypothetical protein